MSKIRWVDKYEILLKESLNTADMMRVLGYQHDQARLLRIEILASLKNEGIRIPNKKKIPTDILLGYIGKDMKYFEQKMAQEYKVSKYREQRKEKI